jgi:hypothetical protein
MSGERVTYDRYPWWVKFTMFGGNQTRQRLIVYCLITAVLAVAFLVIWFAHQQQQFLNVGILGLVLAAFYPAAIWWIDRHGTWPVPTPKPTPKP